ncbi:MAG: hypothetical protein OXC68_14835 [Aestuariivita sp.]|nr:hypothetical protein [Aestuariivita sp.]
MSLLAARCYAIAANILDTIDEDTWRQNGLSDGDVRMTKNLTTLFLRVNSIELGLKHILANEIKYPLPERDRHNLVTLWDRLTDERRHSLSQDSDIPMPNIRQTLERYKNVSVAARFGGTFGNAPASGTPSRQSMLSNDNILKNLANILGPRACPPIKLEPVRENNSSK